MKLNELKTGMRVITRDGNEYIVMKDVDSFTTKSPIMVALSSHDWSPLNRFYTENMKCVDDDEYARCDFSEFDIMKVYRIRFVGYLLTPIRELNTDEYECIYERITKQMTKTEIEDALGYDIEIVDD